MGGYNLGELFGALNLDDSQFTEALARSGGASNLFQVQVDKLNGTLGEILSELGKVGIGQDELTAKLNAGTTGVTSLQTVLNDYVETITKTIQRVQALASAQGQQSKDAIIWAQMDADERIKFANAVAAGDYRIASEKVQLANNIANIERNIVQERINLNNKIAASDRDLANERIRLANLIAEGQHRSNAQEQADTEWLIREYAREAQERVNLANQTADAEARSAAIRQKTANDQLSLNNKIAEGDARMADERVKTANQAAGAEQRNNEEKIKTANQYAEAQYRIDQMVLENQRKVAAQTRDNYLQHRDMMQQAGALTTLGFSAGGAGAASLGAELFTGHEAAQFQDAMTKALAIIGPVSDALRNNLAMSAREAAKETGLAAKDIAEDYGIMAKGGMVATDSFKSIGSFAHYAVANQVDLHEATKQVLTVIEALGLGTSSTTRVMDELTRANQLARGSVEQLAQSMEGRGGLALRNAHVSLEEALAITVAFTKAGFSASEAQTAMSQAVNRLTGIARTHGETQIWVTDSYKKFSSIVYDSQGNVRKLTDILGDLNKAFTGRSAKEVGDLFDAMKMGTTRGVDGIKTLIATAPLIDQLTKAFVAAGGAMDQAFNVQMLSPLKQVELLKARLVDLTISLGTGVVAAIQAVAKVGEPFLKLIENLVKGFSELPHWMQEGIAMLGLFGSVALIVGGGLLTAAGQVFFLAASIKFLVGAEALAAVPGIFNAIVGASAGAVAGVAAVVLPLVALAAAMKIVHDNTPEGGSRIGPIATVMPFASMGLHVLGAMTGGDNNNPVDKSKAETKSGFSSLIDDFRSQVEEAKKTIQGLMSSIVNNDNPLLGNPGAAGKERSRLFASLGLQDFQSQLKAMQADLNEAVRSGILNPGQLQIAKDNIEQVKFKLEELQGTASSFTGYGAADKKKTKALQQQDIAMQFDALGVAPDARPPSSMPLADQYKVLDKVVKDTTHDVTAMYAAIAEGKSKEQTSVSQLESPQPLLMNLFKPAKTDVEAFNEEIQKGIENLKRLHDEAVKAGTIGPGGPDSELKRILTVGKLHGVGTQNEDKFAIDEKATAAKKQFDDVQAYYIAQGKDADATYLAAEKVMIEAIANQRKISAQDYAKSLGVDYDALSKAVANSVSKSNNSWRDAVTETTKQVSGDIRKFIDDATSGLIGLIPFFDTTGKKADVLTTQFRSAFDQLSAYSDPKTALKNLIESIQTAGSAAQANAIAVKFFGATAGPQLANDLRNGSISADQIANAINTATLSTQAYSDATTNTANKVTQLWTKLVKDLLQAILKQLVEQGLKKLIDWMFNVGTASSKMSSDVIDAVKKILQAIGLIPPNLGITVPGGPAIPTPGSQGDIATADALKQCSTAVDANTKQSKEAATITAAAAAAVTAANTADAIAVSLNTKAVSADTYAMATLTAALKAYSSSTLITDPETMKANTDALQNNTNTTGTNTNQGEQPNTKATILNTQAIVANTAALGLNTTALGVLTLAIIALIKTLGALILTGGIGGGGGSQYSGGGGGGGYYPPGYPPGYDPWGGYPGGGDYYGPPAGGSDPYSQDFAARLTNHASKLPGTLPSHSSNSSSDMNINGAVTVVTSNPMDFVRKLKTIRAVNGI